MLHTFVLVGAPDRMLFINVRYFREPAPTAPKIRGIASIPNPLTLTFVGAQTQPFSLQQFGVRKTGGFRTPLIGAEADSYLPLAPFRIHVNAALATQPFPRGLAKTIAVMFHTHRVRTVLPGGLISAIPLF
jgi:hypothetical protein